MSYDFILPSILTQPFVSVSHTPTLETRGDTEQKTSSIFSKFQDAFVYINDEIKSRINSIRYNCQKDRIFEGNYTFGNTNNRGKFEDIPKYVALKRNPYEVKQNTKEAVEKNGFYKLPEEPITVSPRFFGAGKCEGAGVLWLKKTLTGVSIEKRAEKFNEGVPVKAALHQEIYDNISQIHPYNNNTLTWMIRVAHNKARVAPTENFDVIKNEFDTLVERTELPSYSDKTLHVFEAVHSFLSHEKGKLSDSNFIDYVVDEVKRKYNEDINPEDEEYKILQKAQSPDIFVEENNIASLKMKGLEIEDVLVTRFESTADAILNKLDALSLEPGAYKISFPVFDSKGKPSGSHTVQLEVCANGRSNFFDCNYKTVRIYNLTQTIKNLFTEHAGYSPQPLTRTQRIWNQVIGRSSHPIDDPQPTGFELLKIKLA